MRIGKFAELNAVTIDTIRHYMDIGLIIPEKNGGQYSFDERCQMDLDLIIEFKSMGFSLNEIKTFFLYKNFGNLTQYEEEPYYQSLYRKKHQKVELEINNLQEMKKRLEKKLKDLSKKSIIDHSTIGININHIHMLHCYKCQDNLTLQDGVIKRNRIIEGNLSCKCGTKYTIESGILRVGPSFQSEADFRFVHDIGDYIELTDQRYLENINKGLHWSKHKLSQLDLHKKIILELGSGIGFFLRNIYQDLPEDCLYIAVDHSMEQHQFLKSLLERTHLKQNVLFICADFTNIPLNNHSVDILIDHSGTSNYSFEHEKFLLHEVDLLVKPVGYLLGSFFAFKKFSHKSTIAPKLRGNFSIKEIKKNLANLKYQALDERVSSNYTKGGKYENFFVEGEEVFTYSVFGKR